MELQEVKLIYEAFQASNYQSLVNSLLKYAIRYSRLRVEWLLSDVGTRNSQPIYQHVRRISSQYERGRRR